MVFHNFKQKKLVINEIFISITSTQIYLMFSYIMLNNTYIDDLPIISQYRLHKLNWVRPEGGMLGTQGWDIFNIEETGYEYSLLGGGGLTPAPPILNIRQKKLQRKNTMPQIYTLLLKIFSNPNNLMYGIYMGMRQWVKVQNYVDVNFKKLFLYW